MDIVSMLHVVRFVTYYLCINPPEAGQEKKGGQD